MNDDQSRKGLDDIQVEREILAGRKFSLAEAIGRSAGGLMKGTSPITRKRQAEAEIADLLERHLDDPEGALTLVLQREIAASEALLESYDHPAEALRSVVERLVASADRLRRFVTAVDAEWGRMFLEPPHFDRPGHAPDADDPYTVARAKALLQRLLASLPSATGR